MKVKTERGDYRGFYANVRDAIEKKAALDVTPEQALRTMRAIMLAHKSSRERRTVDRAKRWNRKFREIQPSDRSTASSPTSKRTLALVDSRR